jgi:ubiquinone/menaquinone biosynthesis C-methylase UbiE/ferredoxin
MNAGWKMSYVYMKALESAPERYDKGINWLGWGKLEKIRIYIADLIEAEGGNVLELGVGTGTQAILLAKRGIRVIGIDHSPKMLSIAREKLETKRKEGESGERIASKIELQHKAAVQLDEFPSNSFDIVTSTLVFSELHESEQEYVLNHMFRILKPDGGLILADEVVPSKKLKRIAHAIISAPLKLITYLITQTSTKSLRNFPEKVRKAGFEIQQLKNYQLDSFQLIYAKKPEKITSLEEETSLEVPPITPPSVGIGSKFWQTALRFFGHQTEIGIIPVGEATRDSPVLCTCNFKLTVSRLYRFLNEKRINAWILVAPTDGINVWCAACGDEFNAGSVITAIKISNLEKYVNHRRIIMPQLAAPGVDPKKVHEVTGWQCVWGPVQMEDLPEFLEGLPSSVHHKTEKQRAVRFSPKFRLEMASAFFFPVVLILVVPLVLTLYFLNSIIWAVLIIAVIAFDVYFIFLLWPVIPARLGTHKVVLGTLLVFIIVSVMAWLATDYFGVQVIDAAGLQGFLAILNWWPLDIVILLLTIVLIYDADGITPHLRSSLGARSWNKGHVKMTERWGSSYTLTPYGKITADLERCTGCGICVDVCPMLIPVIDENTKKVHLMGPETCVNCRACVKRCPTNALFLEPETEAAKVALETLLAQKNEGLDRS